MSSPAVSFGDSDADAHPLARDIHPTPSSAFPAPTGERIPSPRERRPAASQVPPAAAAAEGEIPPEQPDDPEAPDPPAPPSTKAKSPEKKPSINRLARLLAAVSTQERKDRIYRFRDDYDIKNDGDYAYVILAGGEYNLEMTENSVRRLETVFGEGAQNIAEALNTVDVPRVGEQIAEMAAPLFAARIDRAVDRYVKDRGGDSRRKWGFLYGVLLGGAAMLGAMADHNLDVGHYRDRYDAALAAVPRLQALAARPAGQDMLRIMAANGDDALRGLASCSSAYGLQVVRSRTGDSVCVGSAKASFGFRLP